MKKDKKTIGIIVGAAVAVIVLGVVVFIGMNRDFDARGYVNVILDYTFKGKAGNAGDVFDEDSLVQMENHYETNVAVFVDQNITGGVELDEEMREKYTTLCKDIFKIMKYKVREVDKVTGNEYKVTVEYQAADIFPAYKASAAQEASKIMERVQKGEYQGESAQAIQLQMQQDTVNSNYELLSSAYENVHYGEKEKVVFSVKRDGNEAFALDSDALSEFLVKILSLHEIQD